MKKLFTLLGITFLITSAHAESTIDVWLGYKFAGQKYTSNKNSSNEIVTTLKSIDDDDDGLQTVHFTIKFFHSETYKEKLLHMINEYKADVDENSDHFCHFNFSDGYLNLGDCDDPTFENYFPKQTPYTEIDSYVKAWRARNYDAIRGDPHLGEQ